MNAAFLRVVLDQASQSPVGQALGVTAEVVGLRCAAITAGLLANAADQTAYQLRVGQAELSRMADRREEALLPVGGRVGEQLRRIAQAFKDI